MPLHSMTGFARTEGAAEDFRWTWEVRSVNGKGLDVRVRVSAGFERLDGPARQRCAGRLARGNVQATLTVVGETAINRVKINEGVLGEILTVMQNLAGRIEAKPPTLDGILGIRGVVEMVEGDVDDSTRERLDAEILASLERALDDLVETRAGEGEAIGATLKLRLAEIDRLVGAAERSPARTPEVIRARLAEQVAALLDAAPALDPDRLHQEAVLLATKADIREELDRLEAHVVATRDLLSQGGPVGRRLDFLAQELNREANTLCAKSNHREVTAIGLELKAVVDQLREQIQNLE